MGKRITNAELYQALFEIEGRLDARLTQLQDQLNTHREINHKPPPSTAKVGGIAGAVALVITGLAGIARALGLGN